MGQGVACWPVLRVGIFVHVMPIQMTFLILSVFLTGLAYSFGLTELGPVGRGRFLFVGSGLLLARLA